MITKIALILLISTLANAAISLPNCGLRPLADSSKIVSGDKSIVGDWGWSVSITNNGRHFCGGVLINKDTVLTAAHCFTSSTVNPAHKVDIGLHNRVSKESWVQTRSFSKQFRHEKFSSNTLQNDIALIRLSSPVVFDDKYIVPICIDESTVSSVDQDSQVGWLTGWGTEFFGGSVTVEKMQGSIPIFSGDKCKNKYGVNFFNSDSQICGAESGSNSGACQGDSGGPFVVKSSTDSRWYLSGLISWGISCGQGTVFTRVKYFLPWINSKMAL